MPFQYIILELRIHLELIPKANQNVIHLLLGQNYPYILHIYQLLYLILTFYKVEFINIIDKFHSIDTIISNFKDKSHFINTPFF